MNLASFTLLRKKMGTIDINIICCHFILLTATYDIAHQQPLLFRLSSQSHPAKMSDLKTQTVTISAIPLQGLAQNQQVVECPNCGHKGLTVTSYESSSQTKYRSKSP